MRSAKQNVCIRCDAPASKWYEFDFGAGITPAQLCNSCAKETGSAALDDSDNPYFMTKK